MSQYRKKIDVHSHYLPDFYRDALKANGINSPDGMPYTPVWTAKEHLALKDELNIAKSYISISTPGTHLAPGKDAEARELTRRCNEYGASAVRDHPDRFGLFASLPLPDVEGALAEIDHAIDECGAAGFVLETSCHGIYLGDPRYNTVFDKLNARKAVVLLHPTTPYVCHCSPGAFPQSEADISFASPLHYPRPMMEFFFDTARACTNLILSGTVTRCTDMRFIIPHMGGAFPTMADRMKGFTVSIHKGQGVPTAEQIEEAIRSFYFDTAGWAPFNRQYKLLLEYASSDHICYSAWSPAAAVRSGADHLEQRVPEVFASSQETIDGIFYANAERLMAER